MPNPVIHFEIQVKDAGAAQEFYRKLFDWNIDADNPMNYGVVDTQAGGINGGVTAAPTAPQVVFYVGVDDLQASLDRAESLGGKTVVPPTEIPGVVTFAMMSDPEGNVIGLVLGDDGGEAQS